MNGLQFSLLLLCVIAISAGQLLFKKAGLLLASEDGWLNSSMLVTMFLAALIYGAAALLWIYLLRDIPLSKAYMILALSFVMVPLASIVTYSERVGMGYIIGSAFILTGLILIFRSEEFFK